jgi:propane monooxygenase coupling protein
MTGRRRRPLALSEVAGALPASAPIAYLLVADSGNDEAELAWLQKVRQYLWTEERDGDLRVAERVAAAEFVLIFTEQGRWPVNWPWPELANRLHAEFGNGAVAFWRKTVDEVRAKAPTGSDLEAVLKASKLLGARYGLPQMALEMCGFTLMNNQVGSVVAEVMRIKPNVTVLFLPSMIRVDAVGRMDVIDDEVSEALGEEPGFFDAAEFEENMSTHYGRIIHVDDRTIIFANPEDAADYLGFDLTARS